MVMSPSQGKQSQEQAQIPRWPRDARSGGWPWIPVGSDEKGHEDLAAMSADTSCKGLHCRSTAAWGHGWNKLWGEGSCLLLSFLGWAIEQPVCKQA